MSIINNLKGGIINTYDHLWVRNKSREEFKSKNNQDFKSIANSYVLTDEQKKQTDLLYKENLGVKIPYCWHQFFAAHSGVFTSEYFPDYLLHAYFEHYMNFNVHYAFSFEDKNVLPYIAEVAGVRMPATILSRTCGVLRNRDNDIVNIEESVKILSSAGRLFCKPATGSCGGRGCCIIDFNSLDCKSDVLAVLDDLGKDFVIQELIQCHPSIKALYPGAVNTFRIITYRWKDEFLHMPVFMRIGRGGAVVDNGASGGMFVGVRDDGTLTDYAVTHKELCLPVHPDSGAVFKGHRIACFEKALDAAVKMHKMIPQMGLVYWDFTINELGEPVLIECNILNGTVYAVQMTHGVGPFGDRTPEVLSWIRKMNSVPVSLRPEYAFGKM